MATLRNSPWRMGRMMLVLAFVTTALSMLLVVPQTVFAATFGINSPLDAVDANPGDGECRTAGGVCTLRAAVQEANALGGAHTINLPAGIFTLSIPGQGENAAVTGDLDLSANITISGAGAHATIIQAGPTAGGGVDRVFDVRSGATANISAVTIRHGTTTGGVFGAINGAALWNQGTTTLSDAWITANQASGSGGAIYNRGQLQVVRSTISANTTPGDSGAIQSEHVGGGATALSISNSTLSGNSAGASTGAILIVSPSELGSHTVNIYNTTIADHTAGGGAGAIAISDGTPVVTTVNLQNSIITANSGNQCDGGPLPVGAGNRIDDASCGAGAGNLGAVTGLSSLAANGGATPTHGLLPGSNALDQGVSGCADGTGALTTDQRGQPRPRGAACDLGPFEGLVHLVTSTADSGSGTLREAIDAANGALGFDVINFAIPGVGVQTINVTTSLGGGVYLPVISDPVFIDGWSQGGLGYDGPPLVQIDGAITDTTFGLNIQTTDTTVRGLAINRFPAQSGNGFAIGVFSPLVRDVNVALYGNYVGVAPDGVTAAGNGQGGVWVGANANRVRIGSDANGMNDAAERNLIAGNGDQGLLIESANNTVAGNYIGLNAAGTAALGSQNHGIITENSANTLIGGPTEAARNVIAGNNLTGIFTLTGTTNLTIAGNYIGTNAAGTAALANGSTFSLSGGIYVNPGAGTVTGTLIASNLISGNVGDGISLWNSGVAGTVIQGNRIGVAADGVTVLGNNLVANEGVGGGIALRNFVGATIIGGAGAGEGNLIANSGGDAGVVIYSGSGHTLRGNTISNSAEAGIFLNAANNTVAGNNIVANGGEGVFINGGANNTVGGTTAAAGNLIANNALGGVRVESGADNRIRNNRSFANGGLGIDLGAVGVTPNDLGDGDQGANQLQNYPLIARARATSTGILIDGRINTNPNVSVTIDFYRNATCDASGYGEGQSPLGSITLSSSTSGNASFRVPLGVAVPANEFISATATSADGSSEFSACVVVSPGNDSWTQAQEITLVPGDTVTTGHYIDVPGQSRWYKFDVQPGVALDIRLSDLPADYDLAVYRDIAAAYQSLTSPADLNRLGAEFAPDIYSPDIYSPDIYSPDIYSPDIYSPDIYSPDIYSPDIYSPDIYSPDAFSSAQVRSLIAIKSPGGTAPRQAVVNTWNSSGEFYVRVRSRGAASLDQPFSLAVTRDVSQCQIIPSFPALSIPGGLGQNSYETLILVDYERLGALNDASFQARLEALRTSPTVNGRLVDLNAISRIRAANAHADSDPGCAYAKNVVAAEIKAVIDAFKAANPDSLQYVTLVGSDEVIPFVRFPDLAELANESSFFPPVRDDSPTQAGLRLGYFFTDDPYGAKYSLVSQSYDLPILDLAVGRLVESRAEISTVIDAFLCLGTAACPGTLPGQVATPSSAFISGYDFLSDTADAVSEVLGAGLTAPSGPAPRVNRVVAARECLPDDRLSPDCSWDGERLRSQLMGGARHDLIFLAGHFSPQSALAADYQTRVTTRDLLASNSDFTNTIIFSNGCHSGFNLPDGALRSDVVNQPDWAQAFAARGATSFMGTGYQYGDTDFIEYSELLYLEFSRALRAQDGPVSVGEAVLAAKRAHLLNTGARTAELTVKSNLIAALFGLPMLRIDMPGPALNPDGDGTIVTALSSYPAGPGASLNLNLRYADVALGAGAPLASQAAPVTLSNANDGTSQDALYYSGQDGVVIGAGTPVLPRNLFNVNPPAGPAGATPVLRGVGFRSGSYSDVALWPLTAAPATELSRVRPIFTSDVFFPTRQLGVNYFDQLANDGAGTTRLELTAAQYRSDDATSPTGTLRVYNSYDVRLFYSANFQSYVADSATGTVNTPALAAPVTISEISASTQAGSVVSFQARVTGDLSAGVQEAWVTYTDPTAAAPAWRSLDLRQDSLDTTLWSGDLSLAPGQSAANLRFMVQAVNGVGLVTVMTNTGAYYGVDAPVLVPLAAQTATSLSLSGLTSGVFGGSASFSATLSDAQGAGLGGATISFTLGSQSRRAVTGPGGQAVVSFSLTDLPGDYQVTASYAGAGALSSAGAFRSFTLNPQATQISLEPAAALVEARVGADTTIVALVSAGGKPLFNVPVSFSLSGPGGSRNITINTGLGGRAALGAVDLPAGDYALTATVGANLIGYTSSQATTTLRLTSVLPTLTLGDVPRTPAAEKTTSTATLRGTINPNGAATSWVFRIKRASDASYGQIADLPVPAGLIAAGNTPQAVSVTFSGLKPGTLYSYKLVATNAAGTVETPEKVLLTCYTFSGFFQPIDNGVINTVRAGQAVPVKFSLGGSYGLSIFAAGYPQVLTVSCPNVTEAVVEEVVSATANSLSYNPTSKQYNFVWKTDRNWRGCRNLVLQFNDGTAKVVNFRLR